VGPWQPRAIRHGNAGALRTAWAAGVHAARRPVAAGHGDRVDLLQAAGAALLAAVHGIWAVWAFVALFGPGFGAITPARGHARVTGRGEQGAQYARALLLNHFGTIQQKDADRCGRGGGKQVCRREPKRIADFDAHSREVAHAHRQRSTSRSADAGRPLQARARTCRRPARRQRSRCAQGWQWRSPARALPPSSYDRARRHLPEPIGEVIPICRIKCAISTDVIPREPPTSASS
jgi:hypothetical protein